MNLQSLSQTSRLSKQNLKGFQLRQSQNTNIGKPFQLLENYEKHVVKLPKLDSRKLIQQYKENKKSFGIKAQDQSESLNPAISDATKKNVFKTQVILRRYGWGGFWAQLALTLTSAGIVLFNVYFTESTTPLPTLACVLAGLMAGFFSLIWSQVVIRLGRTLKEMLAGSAKKVKKIEVLNTIKKGLFVNIFGNLVTIFALQSLTGSIVGKTLVSSSTNPFQGGGGGGRPSSPVVALDVFLVQAAANILFSHIIMIAINCYLYMTVQKMDNK